MMPAPVFALLKSLAQRAVRSLTGQHLVSELELAPAGRGGVGLCRRQHLASSVWPRVGAG